MIVEGKDRLGEGVNIAARLQQLAKPGGIVISGTAYDQLKAKVDVGYERLDTVIPPFGKNSLAASRNEIGWSLRGSLSRGVR